MFPRVSNAKIFDETGLIEVQLVDFGEFFLAHVHQTNEKCEVCLPDFSNMSVHILDTKMLGRPGIIAATALEHKRVLVTGNTAHFSWVPGLRVEDWRQG